MSKENLISFLQSVTNDAQLSARLQKQVSYDDFKAIAKDRGFDLGDLSPEDARAIMQIVTGQTSEKLTANELEMVAAGARKVYGDIDGIRESIPEDTLGFYEGWPHKFYEGWPRK